MMFLVYLFVWFFVSRVGHTNSAAAGSSEQAFISLVSFSKAFHAPVLENQPGMVKACFAWPVETAVKNLALQVVGGLSRVLIRA